MDSLKEGTSLSWRWRGKWSKVRLDHTDSSLRLLAKNNLWVSIWIEGSIWRFMHRNNGLDDIEEDVDLLKLNLSIWIRNKVKKFYMKDPIDSFLGRKLKFETESFRSLQAVPKEEDKELHNRVIDMDDASVLSEYKRGVTIPREGRKLLFCKILSLRNSFRILLISILIICAAIDQVRFKNCLFFYSITITRIDSGTCQSFSYFFLHQTLYVDFLELRS
ncbi:hypothetical protein KP509_16G043800 [Ceratopteris richardii]|uniref:Uncharacterized protein n=1 Tax=Ceratopteris richardii TaxID=49495 RepID=A0A8T2T423_CERRI|nr:hypothetical protein KP509_16G043800 [Ceratopteris richardii]